MQIQGRLSHPHREHWEVVGATGKADFEKNTGVVTSQDLVKLTDRLPAEGTATFYHFQNPGVRPGAWRTALTAVQSVGMAAAVGAGGGIALAMLSEVLNVTTLGLVEHMSGAVSGGLGVGLAVGVAATAYGLIADKRGYDREGEYVYGQLRSEYNETGKKELAFYPYATGAKRVNVNEFAQGNESDNGMPWWQAAHRNRI